MILAWSSDEGRATSVWDSAEKKNAFGLRLIWGKEDTLGLICVPVMCPQPRCPPRDQGTMFIQVHIVSTGYWQG